MKTMSGTNLLALQLRVIGALVLRETRATFGTSQIGYLWAVITPAAGVAVLTGLFSMVGRDTPFGASLALFFATGLLTLEYFNKLSGALMNAFIANKALLTYPLIQAIDTLYARLILISVTYLVIMVIFYSGLVVLGLALLPAHPEHLAASFVATGLMGFGFGTFNAVVFSMWESWTHIEKILTRPLFLISGVLYIPSMLPPEAIAYLEWNPVLHLVEWTRVGYYSNYDSTVFSWQYPLVCAMILIFLGLAGERLYRKKRV